jgi:hypothetical protein
MRSSSLYVRTAPQQRDIRMNVTLTADLHQTEVQLVSVAGILHVALTRHHMLLWLVMCYIVWPCYAGVRSCPILLHRDSTGC